MANGFEERRGSVLMAITEAPGSSPRGSGTDSHTLERYLHRGYGVCAAWP